MNRLGKRIEQLENVLNPNPIRVVRVIQKIGETLDQALERDGINDLENTLLIVRKIVEQKLLMVN